MEELLKKIIKYFQDKQSNEEQNSKKQYKKPSISKKGIGSIIFVILAYILVTNSFFTVNEFDQAVVTRFGEVQVVIVEEKTPELEKEIYDIPQFENVKIREGKGLFFKVPVIDQVEKYTSRLLTYNTLAREVTTSDKKKIVLDNNAQWVIRNPLLFRITVNNVRSANTKLDDIIYSKLNEKIGLTDGTTLISDKEYVYQPNQTKHK
jgi:membrane protease subunit HflC